MEAEDYGGRLRIVGRESERKKEEAEEECGVYDVPVYHHFVLC